MRRPLRLAIALGGVLLLVAFVARASLPAGDYDCSGFSFDREAWASDEEALPGGEATLRQRQADGLLACGGLQGKPRADVLDMLGPAEDVLKRPGASTWVTGPARNLIAIDREHLVVQFDGAERVASVRIVTE